jgi:hypothetical protein
MIYLIFSSQSKMAQSALQTLLKKDYPNRDECNFVSLDMGVTPLNELAEECDLLPLGYDKKAVVGENCAFLAKTRNQIQIPKRRWARCLIGLSPKSESRDRPLSCFFIAMSQISAIRW